MAISINASLAEGRTELLARLAAIEKLLAVLASGQGPIGELALATSPRSALSHQAVQILVGFENAKAGKALVIHTFEGSRLVFLDGAGSHGFVPTDPRFFEADLEELLANDLCSLSFNGSGDKVFNLTRKGSRIAQEIIGGS